MHGIGEGESRARVRWVRQAGWGKGGKEGEGNQKSRLGKVGTV